MKREFGKKLIEEFLPSVDLKHVIDTSGAYIPGHGTPTVILFGRNRRPVGDTIRTVMGIRGEPSTPDDAAQGLVWTTIVEQIDCPEGLTQRRQGAKKENHLGGFAALRETHCNDQFVSVGDSLRELFSKHPWSIGGGGGAELKDQLDQSAKTALSKLCDSIGITSFTLEDDIYIVPDAAARRSRLLKVLELLQEFGFCRGYEARIAEKLGVSRSTICRDIARLRRRFWGGKEAEERHRIQEQMQRRIRAEERSELDRMVREVAASAADDDAPARPQPDVPAPTMHPTQAIFAPRWVSSPRSALADVFRPRRSRRARQVCGFR